MVDQLPERFDRLKRLMASRSLPVGVQLLAMSIRPIAHEPQSPWWQLAGQHGQCLEFDRRLVFGVPGVEMRSPAVMDLVVVHPHDDPVERAEPRHPAIVAPAPVRAFATDAVTVPIRARSN